MITYWFCKYNIERIIEMSFYAEVLDRAIEVLGTKESAVDWLEKMSGTLKLSPKDLCSTREGADQVLRHLFSVELALSTD